MTQQELKDRTKKFAIEVVLYYKSMPNNDLKFTLGKQLVRSGTSVGANYRSACRGRSKAEFNAKLGICEEECDETMYWLDVITETCDHEPVKTKKIWNESEELLKIFVSSINTSKANLKATN